MQRPVRPALTNASPAKPPIASALHVHASSICRYDTLSLAKMGCAQRMPTCTGVVDDEGIMCYGKLKQFELRKSIILDENLDGGNGKAKFGTAYLRVDCTDNPPRTPTLPPPPPPPPMPDTPRPSWPSTWECYQEHPNINLPAPLHEDRCSVRFHTLEAAKLGCAQRIPECTGIIDDAGIMCDGGMGQEFELRSSLMMEAAPGIHAWLRIQCAPPPPALAVYGSYTMTIAGGLSAGGVALLAMCGLGFYVFTTRRRRLEQSLLRAHNREEELELHERGLRTGGLTGGLSAIKELDPNDPMDASTITRQDKAREVADNVGNWVNEQVDGIKQHVQGFRRMDEREDERML